MAMDFPSNPTVGDTYSQGSKTWEWDGSVWASVVSTAIQNSLDAKADASHTHEINEITSLQTSLNAKANADGPNFSGNASFSGNVDFNNSFNDSTGRFRIKNDVSMVSGANWGNNHLELWNDTGNVGMAFNSSGASSIGLWHDRGSQRLELGGNTNSIHTGRSIRNITLSTNNPTGGNDGDIWLVYES